MNKMVDVCWSEVKGLQIEGAQKSWWHVRSFPLFYKRKLFKGWLRDGFEKKIIMEFPIKLAGWVLDAPVFH